MNYSVRPCGRLEKVFGKFREGLLELMKVSFSAEQALTTSGSPPEEGDIEDWAVKALATNVAFSRPTGNGVGWGCCSVDIDARGVSYTTGGGIRFGWSVYAADYQPFLETTPEGGNVWTFFLEHPDGCDRRDDSSLLISAKKNGWEEKHG